MTTEATDLEAASRSIMAAVLHLSRRLRAQRPASSVSLSQLSVLGTLNRLGAMPAARLADHERLQPQSLTRMIAELEADELIVRRRGTADRRTLIIELTAKGQLALVRDIGARREWLERAMAATLGPTERALLQLSADVMLKVAACDLG
ncbi:MAG TPA: MarR family transcriptional regulator [Steroidobacteraceae bacterium]|jgi:DNA-binding MarR family transcriptional regulator|nr:MarR family transcriptional regulator [Steroidobacteraceae bacterium]